MQDLVLWCLVRLKMFWIEKYVSLGLNQARVIKIPLYDLAQHVRHIKILL